MVKFNLKKIYENFDMSYNYLYEKKININDTELNYYIFSIFDFYKFLNDNKNLNLKIKEFIKRYDQLDIFYYLFIKYIEFNNNIHIVLVTKKDNFIGFFTSFYDIHNKFSFGEHLLINPDFRNLGIGTTLIYYYFKFFFKRFNIPFYGIILGENKPSVKLFENFGAIIYDDTDKIKKVYCITRKIFNSNKKNIKKY